LIPARASFLVGALAAASVAGAQDVTPVVDRWAVGTELALNAAQGNSSYTMLTSALRFTHLNRKQFELDWASGITYGESEGKVIARRMTTALKTDFHPQATWSTFLFATLERDRIRRLDLLSNSGAGTKWTYFRNARGAASLSLAALYSYKSILAADPPVPPTGDEPPRSTARLSIRPKVSQKLPSGLSFEQTTFWQPVIRDMGDYNVDASSRLSYAVSKTSTVFLQHTYRNDSRPPSGVKREDQLLVAGVKAQF
jgi:hypothetical protein